MYWPVVLGGGIGVAGLGALLVWAFEWRTRFPTVCVSFPRWLLPFFQFVVSGGAWAYWWVTYPGRHPEPHYTAVAVVAFVYGFGLVGCAWAGLLYQLSTVASPRNSKQDVKALLAVLSLFEGIALTAWYCGL